MMPLSSVENANKPGDRTLTIFIVNTVYRYVTYSTNTENTATNHLYTDINYDPTYLTSWTYIYFGYSRPL